MRPVRAILTAAGALLLAAPAAAQDEAAEQAAGLFASSAWDLELGAHAYELSMDDYIDYACGTNGGPPSLPLSGWADWSLCQPEAGTGFYEIYFQYDDETEYWARAHDLEVQIRTYEYTSAYQIPVIASALFDDRGFLIGIRLITDNRVPVELREKGVALANFLRARYGTGWTCEDLPRLEGEIEFQGSFEKRRCNKVVADAPYHVMIVTHSYRKPGQFAINPGNNRATEGQFVSSTLYELTLLNAADGQPREVPPVPTGLTERELLAERARDCPGCDLQGVNLKRADLRGANLAGANLAGANLHAAFLGGANLAGANMEGANLNRADLKRAILDDANIQKAMMYETRFNGASLVGADLTLTNAGKVQFIGADLTRARMVAMDLRNARMNDATFIHADLSGSLMDDSQLARSDFTDAFFIQAGMHRVSLIEVNLTGADMRNADMVLVNLRGANLTDADFSFARLPLANMSEVITDGAKWTDAELPGGFVPN